MGMERNHALQIGMETVYGDGGATPTYMPVFYTDARPAAKFAAIENPTYGGSMGRNRFQPGQAIYTMPMKFFLKGSGTAGIAPEIAKILKLAGMGETIVAVTSASYSPVNSAYPSGTITLNLDGTQYLIKGSRLEQLTFPLVAGMPVTCEAKLQGLFAVPTVVSFPTPTFTDAAIVAPVVSSMALTLGGSTFVMPKITFDLKNVIGKRDNVNAANLGIQELSIVGREWGGTFTVEVDANNDTEFWTAIQAGTEQVVASAGFGTAGNMIAFSMSNLQFEDITPAVLNGVTVYDCTFRINKNSVLASEFKLMFT
jgi:hypothetical protein